MVSGVSGVQDLVEFLNVDQVYQATWVETREFKRDKTGTIVINKGQLGPGRLSLG